MSKGLELSLVNVLLVMPNLAHSLKLPQNIQDQYPPSQCYAVELGKPKDVNDVILEFDVDYVKCQADFECIDGKFSNSMFCALFIHYGNNNLSLLEPFLTKPKRGLIVNVNDDAIFAARPKDGFRFIYPEVKLSKSQVYIAPAQSWALFFLKFIKIFWR